MRRLRIKVILGMGIIFCRCGLEAHSDMTNIFFHLYIQSTYRQLV